MLSVFHCADIHLDSPFAASTPDIAASRRQMLRQTFLHMVQTAVEQKADLFLLCGDLFDREFVTRETADFVCRLFEGAPSLRFVILPGNHDPYTEEGFYRKTAFPDNVFIFKKDTLSCISFPELGCDLYGAAFTSPRMEQNPFAARQPLHENRINILLGHGTWGKSDGSCPISEEDIRSSGFDYYALGHYHKSEGITRLGYKYYGYSGCPQGRDFGETGIKGAYLVQMDKKDGLFSADARFIPFCQYRYEWIVCNLSQCQSADDMLASVNSAILEKDLPQNTALRITLQGAVPAELRFPAARLRLSWQEYLAELEIDDQTVPFTADRRLEGDPTLRGAFFAILQKEMQSDDPAIRDRAVLAFRYGLAALDGSDLDFE